MENGSIVEFIDREKIVCAVVLELKKLRLRLLTENNREVKLSANRLVHIGRRHLDLGMGRDKLVGTLKGLTEQRNALAAEIDLKELWEVLNSEQEWIDLDTMTDFCFPQNRTQDHESAVIRAFFGDRIYFKFNPDSFFPNSQERVEEILAQAEETARRNRIIKTGSDWVKRIGTGTFSGLPEELSEDQRQVIAVLREVYLFGKESPQYELGRALLKNAGISDPEKIFGLLVKLGAWDENENIDIYRLRIPVDFDEAVMQNAQNLLARADAGLAAGAPEKSRRDLTGLSLITIDGQSTLDFDDAISIEPNGEGYRLGVHITDVGHFVKKGDPLDQEALARGSAIYMPDQKIPMLPPCLSEDLCSLKADSLRPAVSVLINLSRTADILDYEITASMVRVKRQLTYYDVNSIAEEDGEIRILHEIAQKFRAWRLEQRALQITLPEVNVWLDKEGGPIVSRVDRESPGRMLVAEIMIMANWLMAKFLAAHEIPAVFRSQPEPKERLFKDSEGTLFQNWMQRKYLSRFVLNTTPEFHSGLGLETYVTATSPIRKYFDLVTQRQLRALLGLESPNTQVEMEQTIQMLQAPMEDVAKIQFRRNRYWLLKYLEKQTGAKEEAIVLGKQRNGYRILLTQYLIECMLPLSSGIQLNPEDLVQVTIQHVNARKEILTVHLG